MKNEKTKYLYIKALLYSYHEKVLKEYLTYNPVIPSRYDESGNITGYTYVTDKRKEELNQRLNKVTLLLTIFNKIINT